MKRLTMLLALMLCGVIPVFAQHGEWQRGLIGGTGITISHDTISASGGGSGLSVAQITLTSAQWDSLHVTKQQIVAAPGANKIILPVGMIIRFNYTNSTFNNESGIGLETDSMQFYIIDGSPVTGPAPATTVVYGSFGISGVLSDIGGVENSALYAFSNSKQTGGGTGTVTITVLYQTVTTH